MVQRKLYSSVEPAHLKRSTESSVPQNNTVDTRVESDVAVLRFNRMIEAEQ